MKRHVIIPDLHGCYDQLIEMLDLVKYDHKEDQLILLGDYIDRGPKSKETVNKVRELVKDGAIALQGNHEQMLIDATMHINQLGAFLSNGGYQTLESYGIEPKQARQMMKNDELAKDVRFVESLPFQYEIDGIRFVHGGVNKRHPWNQQIIDEMVWIRPRVQDHFDGYLPGDTSPSVIIHGHTPTVNITGEWEAYIEPWIINLDCGAVYGGKLCCMLIDKNKAYEFVYIDGIPEH